MVEADVAVLVVLSEDPVGPDTTLSAASQWTRMPIMGDFFPWSGLSDLISQSRIGPPAFPLQGATRAAAG